MSLLAYLITLSLSLLSLLSSTDLIAYIYVIFINIHAWTPCDIQGVRKWLPDPFICNGVYSFPCRRDETMFRAGVKAPENTYIHVYKFSLVQTTLYNWNCDSSKKTIKLLTIKSGNVIRTRCTSRILYEWEVVCEEGVYLPAIMHVIAANQNDQNVHYLTI